MLKPDITTLRLHRLDLTRRSLLAFARQGQTDDLFAAAEADARAEAMEVIIARMTEGLAVLKKPDPWSPDIKATDEFLDPLLANYAEKLELPGLFRKSDYHEMTEFLNADEIDSEIGEKLDAIVDVASRARPRTEGWNPRRRFMASFSRARPRTEG